jgi:predicted O-methyltransferase YrrM
MHSRFESVLTELKRLAPRLSNALRHPSQSWSVNHPIKAGHRFATFVAASVEGAHELQRLKREIPALEPIEEFTRRAMSELQASHRVYVTEVSTWKWAISLETAGALLACCRLLEPERVLDTGSGYTSFILRMYATQAPTQVEVVSVDDDLAWLEKTKAFLTKHGVGTDGTLMSWNEAQAEGLHDFDLVIHDLGAEELRARTLHAVLGAVRAGGVALLDDMHFEHYGRYARRVLRAAAFDSYSLRSVTREETYGRYAVLARRSTFRKSSSGAARVVAESPRAALLAPAWSRLEDGR